MHTAQSELTDIGLRADLKRQQIELLSQVKGTYAP